MGTVFEGPEWCNAIGCVSPDEALEKFGWSDKPTAAQVHAAVAYAEWYRNRYLVDRRDEIASGFAEIAQQAANSLDDLSGRVRNIAEMLDLHACGRPAK